MDADDDLLQLERDLLAQRAERPEKTPKGRYGETWTWSERNPRRRRRYVLDSAEMPGSEPLPGLPRRIRDYETGPR